MIYLDTFTPPAVTALAGTAYTDSDAFWTSYYDYYDTVLSSLSSTYSNIPTSTSSLYYVGNSSCAGYSKTYSTLDWSAMSGLYNATKQSYYLMINASASSQLYAADSYIAGTSQWVVDAGSIDSGVRLINSIGGKNGNATNAYLISFPQTPDEYYGTFSIQKTNSSGTAIATSGIKFGVYTTYSNGSVSGLVETITTDSTGLASFDTGKLTSKSDVTYYVKETSLPSSLSGYTVSSTIYKVVITPGTATDGSDSTIAVTNAATGATISTSASTIGHKFNFPNTPKTYLGQFSIQKVDDAGNKITQSGIQFGIYSTYSNGSVSGLVATVTTGTDGIATYTPSSWTAAADNSNQTKTYYVREISTGSSGTTLSNLDMTANTDIYRVKLTGSTTSATSSTITVTNMTNTSTSVTVTSSNTLGYIFYLPNEQLTEYTVTKTFGDNTGDKVTGVLVYLYDGDGNKISQYQLKTGDWTHTFTGLPKYDDDGNEIEYYSKEIKVTYTDVTDTSRTVDYDVAKTIFTISNGGKHE